VAILALLTMVAVAASVTAAMDDQGQACGKKEAVIATVNVGRYPHGVAVNKETDRVYVANFNERSISVIDGTTNEVIDTIEVGRGPRDVAVNARTNRLYVTNSDDDTVSVLEPLILE
jgi:YVTN family beta-propeller protein